MADYGIFLGFGLPYPGREEAATNLFGEFVAYLRSQQEQGSLDSFEPCLIMPHGGDLSGFVLIRGEQQKLQQLYWSDAFQDFAARGAAAVTGFGIVNCVLGRALERQLARDMQAVAVGR